MKSVADIALSFLSALALWEIRIARMAARYEGRRASARLADELGELRRTTARLAIIATEMSCPPDPEAAREALRRLLTRLRLTGALPWSDAVEILNEVAEATPAPRN
ncbi:hypothetical protein [Zavarzinia aquatilis]|uniref:Uncharacterized protein n=1 Tax=Zavarzinia aquatilis TaxID=2211142 RepID=A0A317DUK8_9PROT|nr:hypothetical protein [Zavarzinia aquatilis]PWR17660.1 hypothetical protein DKG74_20855 [Zavarzinia aquatilis]